MPIERGRRLKNWIVLDVVARHNEVASGEAIKGKDSPFSVRTVTGKGKDQAKYHPVIEGDSNWPKVLRYLAN